MPLSAFSDVMHILSWVISGCLQLLEIYWNFIVPPGNFLTDDISILIKFDLQCRRYSVNINSCMNDHICNMLVTAVVSGWSNTLFFIKLPTARRLYSLTMSVCLFICLFVCHLCCTKGALCVFSPHVKPTEIYDCSGCLLCVMLHVRFSTAWKTAVKDLCWSRFLMQLSQFIFNFVSRNVLWFFCIFVCVIALFINRQSSLSRHNTSCVESTVKHTKNI